MGARKQPSYRVVVADQRAPRDGKFVEIIGHYNPRTEPITFHIDEERALHWLSEGAQPSEPVERLLKKGGTLDRFSRLRAGESMESLLTELQKNLEDQERETKAAKSAEQEVQPVEEASEDTETEKEPVVVDD
jgi:small subunit ribosomal protein S16